MKLLLANTLNVVWILCMGATLIVHVGSLFTNSFNGGPFTFMLIPVLLGWVIGLLLRLGGVFVDIGRIVANGLKGKMLFGPPEVKSRNLPAWVTKANVLLGFYAVAALLFSCIGAAVLKLVDPNRLLMWFLSGVSLGIYWQVWTMTYEWLRNLRASSDTLESF